MEQSCNLYLLNWYYVLYPQTKVMVPNEMIPKNFLANDYHCKIMSAKIKKELVTLIGYKSLLLAL